MKYSCSQLGESVRTGLHIYPRHAEAVALLLRRKNAVTAQSLWMVLYGAEPDCDQPSFNAIFPLMCAVRHDLAKLNIELTQYDDSELSAWSLAAYDKAKLRSMIGEMS